MSDLHRTCTRRQSPRISEVMAESGPQVGGGKAPIVRYAMSRGSIRGTAHGARSTSYVVRSSSYEALLIGRYVIG